MIKGVYAKKILDSRNKPTIECSVTTDKGSVKASIPCGASRGDYEAFFIDNEKALKNINEVIAKKIQGRDVKGIDDLLIEMDGTNNKKNLGANAILAVSVAVCKAGALEAGVPVYKYLGSLFGTKKFVLPFPMMVFIEGGKHSVPEFSSTDMQEFMVIPKGKTFEESMEFGKDVYKKLKEHLQSLGLSTEIGTEGAFTPSLENEKAMEILTTVIEDSGYDKRVSIALDAAASEFYEDGKYTLKAENRVLSSADLIELYADWIKKYPITSIEDGLSQYDLDGWKVLNKELGKKISIVGDDLTVTNIKRLEMVKDSINAVIVKPTQIGTVSETLAFSKMAMDNKMDIIVSHRGGETMDSFKSDLCVAIAGKFAKFGAPSRPERIVKYDRLAKIEQSINQ